MRDHFYQKTWFKNTILITIPSLISFLGILIAIDNNDIIKTVSIVSSIFLMVCLIFAVIYFSNQDDKLYNDYNLLKDDNLKLSSILAHMENNYKMSTFTVSVFSEYTEKWAKNINSFSKNVISNGYISDKAWDSIKFYDSICSNCRSMIEQYCNDYDNSKISVSFVLYKIDENNIEWVHMVAHSNPESTRPNACKDEQKLSECIYHYGDLIKNRHSDIEIAINNEEIRRIFHMISVNTDLSKYTQYIAIPIYCNSKKLLGIFQIVTKYNYIIEDDRIKLLKFVTDNIIPYSNMILLVDKINKGLYVSPTQINKEN